MPNTNGDNRKCLQPWDILSINIKVGAWAILPYCLGNFFSLKFQEVEMVLQMDLEYRREEYFGNLLPYQSPSIFAPENFFITIDIPVQFLKTKFLYLCKDEPLQFNLLIILHSGSSLSYCSHLWKRQGSFGHCCDSGVWLLILF